MLIRTKLLLLALVPVPVLLVLGALAVFGARERLAAAERMAAALQLVEQGEQLAQALVLERDQLALAATSEARGLESLLLGDLAAATLPAAPAARTVPRLLPAGAQRFAAMPLENLPSAIAAGARQLGERLAEVAAPAAPGLALDAVVARYVPLAQAAAALPDLASDSATAELARQLRAAAILFRLHDSLALERIYVRHAIATNTLAPELQREFAANRGIGGVQERLLADVFGDGTARQALTAALTAAAQAGRDTVLREIQNYARRQDRLALLYDALGYGGLRYSFSNYLLRGEDRVRADFDAQAAAARGIVDELAEGGFLSPAELADLAAVRRMIDAHVQAMERVVSLRAQGLPPSRIDRLLQIDDASALAALDRLAAFRSAVSEQDWDKLSLVLLGAFDTQLRELVAGGQALVQVELLRLRRQMLATLGGLALTFLLMLGLAWPLYRRLSQGIAQLVQEFERVVRTGDVLPRQVVTGADELAQLNQAVVSIGRRLDALATQAERMAVGDSVGGITPLGPEDRLATAMAALADSARDVMAQAQAIASGNYELTVQPRGARDQLAFSLANMAQALRNFRDETRQAQWLSDGQLRVLEAMRAGDSVEALAGRALAVLSGLVGAPLGVVYFLQPDGLHAAARHATAADLDIAAHLGAQEGLAGRALAGERTQLQSTLPRGYLRLKSGLGEADVASVTLTPLRARGEAAGLLELGWLAAPEPRLLALLDAVAEPLGLALVAADARVRTEALLAETRIQADRLKQQQEELRQTNEELEEQTQMLRQSEEELKAQREELQTTNEELGEKSNLLQRQREQLERTAQELMRATRYKSEFLANMSHELRTPLNSLLILSKSLAQNEEGNLTPDQVEAARVIHDGGRDLLNLINDILDLSKVEAGRLDVHAHAFPLADLVDSLRRQFQPVADQKGVELRFSIGGGLPAEIVSDRQRVEQILRNLLSNALKFTERGSVALGIERTAGGMLSFAVDDTGIGIPEDKLELIFQAFQQADGSTSRKYGGTGLGLTIARQLAGMLGGSIEVSSRPGQGSRFVLALPERMPEASTGAPASAAAFAPAPVRPPPGMPEPGPLPPAAAPDDRAAVTKGERSILVIEDDLAFANIVRDVVRKRGYKCLLAADGSSGLQMARHFLPSAIILDLKLPDMDGRRVLDILKWSPATRHIPVHVVSALDASSETLKQGAIGFLHKPAERSDLLAAVDRIEATLSRDRRTVLVVEDDRGSQHAIESLLKNERTQVLEATTAARALEVLRSTPVDCIVLDLTLPDSDGITFLEQLRRDREHAHPPVVVYTGRSLSTEEHRRLSELAQSVVIKGAASADRLLDEVMLFLHAVEAELPEAQKQVVARLHSGAGAFEGRKLLLVDDDLRNVFALSGLLRKRGFEVLVADNGQMALEKLDQQPDVDAVLMDVMMPVMDGFEATRRIRAQPRFANLPVIAVTAKAMAEDRRKCMEAGASDYLSKPVEIDALLAMLRVWLSRRA